MIIVFMLCKNKEAAIIISTLKDRVHAIWFCGLNTKHYHGIDSWRYLGGPLRAFFPSLSLNMIVAKREKINNLRPVIWVGFGKGWRSWNIRTYSEFEGWGQLNKLRSLYWTF